MLVVLGEEAEGYSCHGIVTPGPVQAAEEITAFLGKEGVIWVQSPVRTWHGEPQDPDTSLLHGKCHRGMKGCFWTHQAASGDGNQKCLGDSTTG